MQFTMFPEAFKRQLVNQMNLDIQEEKRRSQEKINSINASQRQKSESGIIGGILIGGLIGFFTCFSLCWYDPLFSDVLGIDFLGVETGFVSMLFITVIGAVIGCKIDKKAKKNDQDEENRVKEEIGREQARCEDVIQQLQSKMQKEYEEYKRKFEQEVQVKSVNLAESGLASQVNEWLAQGFRRSIDAADRREHIETIYVPFVFNVYKNEIVCNIGTFDFQLQRCRFLSDISEQEALARVIASGVRMQITMNYSKDVAGGDFRLDIEYSHSDMGCVVAMITYVAPNGNYTSVRNW